MDRNALPDRAAAEGEHAVDQRAAALARHDDAVEVTREAAALWRIAQCDLAVAEDRAQDVVEVVRDAAGERAHRLQALGATQLLLHLAHLGDVADDADDPLRHAVRVAKHLPAAADRARLLAAQDAVFEFVLQSPPGESRAPLLRDPRPIVRVVTHVRHDVAARTVPRVLRHVHHPQGLGGGEDLVGLHVPVEMPLLGHVQSEGVALFREPQRLLRQLARRDVGDHADAPARAALGVARHQAARVDPARLARAGNDAVLELVGVPRRVFPVRPEQVGEDVTVIRVERYP